MEGKISTYVDDHAEELVERLREFLRQPSISTQNIGMEECTKMLEKELTNIGLNSKILTLVGAFPAVYGVGNEVNSNRKLLVYGHYDVQAPEPLELWDTPPFSADLRNGMIYARGATDDKGNLYANLMAAKVLRDLLGKVPDGLKFIFEGEEEVGSPNLSNYFHSYADMLACDAAILCDRGVHESGRPQIYLGNKGLLEVEISCKRAKRDVHSGHAPLINNSLWDIVRLLRSMKNDLDEITIPEYSASTCEPTEDECILISSIPFDLKEFRREYGIAEIIGSEDNPFDVIKRLLYTPTCNISGIRGGWTGERGKTIIPCEGWVRVDMRLVKGISVAHAKECVTKFIEASPYGPFNVKIKGNNEHYQCPPSNELVQMCMSISEQIYGQPPVVWPLLDGSGPLCMFPSELGGDVFIVGLGAPFLTANTHAPNENISVNQYLTGIKMMANLFYNYLR